MPSSQHIEVRSLRINLVTDVPSDGSCRVVSIVNRGSDLYQCFQSRPTSQYILVFDCIGFEYPAIAYLYTSVVGIHLRSRVSGLIVAECIDYLFVQSALIVLDGKEVMSFPVKDILSDINLCTNRIYRDCGTFDIQFFKKLRYGDYFIFLVFETLLSYHNVILADIGVHDIIAFRAMLFRRCASELFAIYDNLLLSKRVKELPAMLNQTSLNLIGIHGAHQPLESVR